MKPRTVLLLVVLVAGCSDERTMEIRVMGATDLGTEGVILQRTRFDCGLACLAMVCRDRGIAVTLEQLEPMMTMTTRGVTLLSLKQAAERVGLRATGWRRQAQDLRLIRCPAILFIRDAHFVVLDSVTTDASVFLRDPAIGRIYLKEHRFSTMWKGEVLELVPNVAVER
jgi:ATP-binding cassette subfamily B protein RaxB